ncbi:SDR family NAD(P)-dependent oxidoreductase [Streptomyces sp. NBC_01497]|uniref:SDR family NAD(P)-dependent oxidoreductase n=1 Tax=Streptomyces sp. NBC_01497 TaxID=2903885 RepID=UPI002E37361E|nr:SDR family oxidoreductase [Streptomyces sp. NBC_01497]
MSSPLQGRHAVVTGAGRNVGAAIAGRFVRDGARVVVADVDFDAASRVAKGLNDAYPGSAVPLAADVSSGAEVAGLVDSAWAALGHIDTLVNCVAITDRPTTVLDLSDDLWRKVIDVSLTSAFLTTKYLAKKMVAEGRGGVVVHIGSTSGQFARKNALAYPTAKAALYALVRSLAVQLGPHGIRVNTVSPNKVGSPVGTDVEPENRERRNLVGRACTPEDIAAAVAFMVGAEAGFITGTDLLVDGGALLSTGD